MATVKEMKSYEELASQLYFAKEAADYLGISVQRLASLIQEGKIHPLKKNPSGTVFHIDELQRRKSELKSFSEVNRPKQAGSFRLDTPVKSEALNFAVIMNSLQLTESRLEPLFDDLSKSIDVSSPMDDGDLFSVYADFFRVDRSALIKEYDSSRRCFSNLRYSDEIIKRGAPDYPVLLEKTEQAPRFLYLRGRKSLLQSGRTVALVGSRQASEKARNNTRYLANVLGRNGITVVSGLAKGIDVNAHIAALDSGFNTIAVIGTHLNQYYPSENRSVQVKMETDGLVISQFPPSLKTERWFFPLRNGVMSGLSLATVIMEAGETSGALKQADFALKQGRKVLIPESALHITSISWPAKYVKRGAVVVRTPADVIRVLSESDIFRVETKTTEMSSAQDSLDFGDLSDEV